MICKAYEIRYELCGKLRSTEERVKGQNKGRQKMPRVEQTSANPNIIFCASYPQIKLKPIRFKSNLIIYTITTVYILSMLMYVPIPFAISSTRYFQIWSENYIP
jgi:hypothetical protein